MKQDLTLNVGTKYNGDGLKKLNTAVATTAKNVGSASRALQSVSAELNQIGGKAGQAAGAIGGLFQAFGQGGIAAVVVTAITGAVGLLVGAFQKAKEAAKDAAEALSKSFDLAVQKTVDRIAKIKAALGFTQKQNAVDQGYAAGQISNAQRQSQLVIRNRYAAQKAGATSDLERARIDAAEKRDLAIDDARWKRSNARAANDNAMTNEQAVRAAQERLAVEVGKQEKALAEQRKLLDNSPLKKEYDTLKKAVDDAAADVKQYGENGTRNYTITQKTAQGGEWSYNVQGNVSAVYEKAVARIKEFTDEHGEVESSIKSYEAAVKALEKSQSELQQVTLDAKKATNDSLLAYRQKELAEQEYKTAVKAANQQYKDDIKKAKEQAKQKADAEKKQTEAERKQAEAERKQAEATLKAAQDEEKKARRNELQKQLDNLTEAQRKTALQQLNERRAEADAAKQLAEAEKKAKEVIDGWAGNRKQGAGAWGRGQDAEAAARLRQAEAERGNVSKAQREAAALAGAIFGANGIRGTASVAQIGKFAQLSDYLGGGNLTDAQRQSLQSAADKLRAKVFDSKGNLKVSHGSQELKNFTRIQKILDKMKAVDAARQLQAEAKKREERNARIQEQQYQAVKDIRDQMKNLGV